MGKTLLVSALLLTIAVNASAGEINVSAYKAEETSVRFIQLNPLFFSGSGGWFSINIFQPETQSCFFPSASYTSETAPAGNMWAVFALMMSAYTISCIYENSNPQAFHNVYEMRKRSPYVSGAENWQKQSNRLTN